MGVKVGTPDGTRVGSVVTVPAIFPVGPAVGIAVTVVVVVVVGVGRIGSGCVALVAILPVGPAVGRGVMLMDAGVCFGSGVFFFFIIVLVMDDLAALTDLVGAGLSTVVVEVELFAVVAFFFFRFRIIPVEADLALLAADLAPLVGAGEGGKVSVGGRGVHVTCALGAGDSTAADFADLVVLALPVVSVFFFFFLIMAKCRTWTMDT